MFVLPLPSFLSHEGTANGAGAWNGCVVPAGAFTNPVGFYFVV